MGKEFKRKLALVLVGDEEVGQKGSKYLLKKRKDFFNDIKYGLVAEPTDLKLKIAQKGIMHIKFKFRGRAAHASTPWKGNNAILKASNFIQEVNNLSERLKKVKYPLLGCPTINVGKIIGGTKVNIVPEFCEVEIDRRLLPGETPERVLNEFKVILKKLKLKAKIEQIIRPRLAMKIPANSEIVKLIQGIVKTRVEGEYGYTEAELYYRKLGTNFVIFGPTSTAHQANEFVKIRDLKKARFVYEKSIEKWCC
ncbi:MAG: M20/M25/M40 family metallo-hydrolase [Candidatus Aenigmarchaeota archaeon]|nr:M20/M25/M40 family metallo-hydrolase [Candidatus Aenigmarchaeota archaeon]